MNNIPWAIIIQVGASLINDIAKIVADTKATEDEKKAKILALRPTLKDTNAAVQSAELEP